MNKYNISTITLTCISLLFLAGCSEHPKKEALSTSDIAKAMDIKCWNVLIPEEINHGDNLVLYFENSSGEKVGKSANISIHPSSGDTVKIMMYPVKDDPFGEVVGYSVTMADVNSVMRRTLHNPLSSELDTSSSSNDQTHEVGDILMVFAPSDTVVSSDKIRASQIGLRTKIVNYN